MLTYVSNPKRNDPGQGCGRVGCDRVTEFWPVLWRVCYTRIAWQASAGSLLEFSSLHGHLVEWIHVAHALTVARCQWNNAWALDGRQRRADKTPRAKSDSRGSDTESTAKPRIHRQQGHSKSTPHHQWTQQFPVLQTVSIS